MLKGLERVESIAYKLKLPQELSRVHNTFHISNLKKCCSDDPLAIPLEGLHIDDKFHLVEEPVVIMDRDIKRLKSKPVIVTPGSVIVTPGSVIVTTGSVIVTPGVESFEEVDISFLTIKAVKVCLIKDMGCMLWHEGSWIIWR
ncbi:hypothetical protein Tco_0000204, partial [Tanacetum coccineum]